MSTDASPDTTTPATAPPADLSTAPVLAAQAPDGYELLELDPASHEDAIRDVDSWGFAFARDVDAERLLGFSQEAGRCVGVRWAGAHDLAGYHGSFAFSAPVPGGSLPAAGLTWVAVHPGHRRRGIARAMLTEHLRRTAARGEALSALWAAEPGIYGRYGYGQAASHLSLSIPRGAGLRPVAGAEALHVELTAADPDRHAELAAGLHAAAARPGWITPRSAAIRRGRLTDVPSWREGAEPLRIAIVRDAAGEARGFATFRRKESWNEHNSPGGTLSVSWYAYPDAATAHALWSTLLDLDLMATVKAGIVAVDDPLLQLLTDVRRAVPIVSDNVWLRLVDVPTALAGRAYAAPLDVVLDITDEILPANAGRWRLQAGGGGAHGLVERTERPADLGLDVRTLGSAYLGGSGLGSLAAAGLVEVHDDAALLPASAAFSWAQAPVCNWVF